MQAGSHPTGWGLSTSEGVLDDAQGVVVGLDAPPEVVVVVASTEPSVVAVRVSFALRFSLDAAELPLVT